MRIWDLSSHLDGGVSFGYINPPSWVLSLPNFVNAASFSPDSSRVAYVEIDPPPAVSYSATVWLAQVGLANQLALLEGYLANAAELDAYDNITLANVGN